MAKFFREKKRGKMINNKIKGSAAIAASILMLAGAGLLTSTASWSDDTAGDADGNTAATTSTLDTQEKCTWYVTGIPTQVALLVNEASDDNGTNGKYDGTTLALTKTLDSSLTAYTSGNSGAGSADGNTECTFYNSKTGISISNSISTYSVAASVGAVEESGMGFNLSSSNALSINYSEGTCWSDADADEATSGWTIGSASLYGAGNNTASVLSLSFANTQQVNSLTTSERCSAGATYSMNVPSGKEPASPGSDYVFTGPTVTFGVTLPTS